MKNSVLATLAVAGIAGGGAIVGASPAQADTAWNCMTWEPTFFADSGGCTEVIYSRKDKGKWCQVRADRVLFRTTDHYYSYNDTAARINSLDIQKGSASGKFLFSKDDKRVKNRDPHARRGWDPAGSWRGKALEVTTDFHLNLKGQPDKGATVWFTIGPFDKDCN